MSHFSRERQQRATSSGRKQLRSYRLTDGLTRAREIAAALASRIFVAIARPVPAKATARKHRPSS